MTLTPDDVRLDGRVAIVTGAAQGIGRASALALAAFGADVAVCDRNEDGLKTLAAELESSKTTVVTGVLDVRHADAVAAWLGEVAERFTNVHILVNNAGGTFVSAFLDTNAKGQTALVDENFTSVTHFVRGTVPLMPDVGGSIINVTSIEAHRAAPMFGVYSAMKAAVENLSKTLALELADRAIRVNCIAPDVIPTEGDSALADQMHAEGEKMSSPLLREGHVDDVAGAVVYLASDLSRFVTGTTIHVDGGNDAARGWHRRPDGSWKP